MQTSNGCTVSVMRYECIRKVFMDIVMLFGTNNGTQRVVFPTVMTCYGRIYRIYAAVFISYKICN